MPAVSGTGTLGGETPEASIGCGDVNPLASRYSLMVVMSRRIGPEFAVSVPSVMPTKISPLLEEFCASQRFVVLEITSAVALTAISNQHDVDWSASSGEDVPLKTEWSM